jgi:hypothetical protein
MERMFKARINNKRKRMKTDWKFPREPEKFSNPPVLGSRHVPT